MTPLEAMSAGVPAVVLDTPVAREVYGDAAIFVARRRHRRHGRGDSPAPDRAVERGADPRSRRRRFWRAIPGTPRPTGRSSTSRGSRGAMTRSRSSSSASTRATDLERCLESLHAAPPAIAHDITVVDNASTDGGLDASRARWPDTRSSRSTRIAASRPATTPASARRRASCCCCSTATPSCRPARSTRSSRGCARIPAAAVAGPRLVDADGRAELSFGPMISPLGELRQKARRSALRRRDRRRSRRGSSASTRREQDVDWVSGACLLVRRADAEAVGPARRALLPLHRGRRLLRRPPRAWPPDPVRAGRGSHAPARPLARQRAGGDERRLPPQPLAFYEKHHPGWARCCAPICASKAPAARLSRLCLRTDKICPPCA